MRGRQRPINKPVIPRNKKYPIGTKPIIAYPKLKIKTPPTIMNAFFLD
jgi:hypothetical protein